LFRVLVTLAAGRGKQAEPAVKAFAESTRVRLTTKPELPLGMRYWDYESQQPAPVHASELLFAQLCLSDPALADYGAGLLEPMLARARDNRNAEYPGNAPNTQNYEYLARIRAAQDRLTVAKA